MSRPAIQSVRLNEHLTLSECHPDSECRASSWWLYDERAGMNLGMREETRDAAFVAAIEYWAERALASARENSQLWAKVRAFVALLEDEDLDILVSGPISE